LPDIPEVTAPVTELTPGCGRAATSASAPLAVALGVSPWIGPAQTRPICPALFVSSASIEAACYWKNVL
jgi:hypothetical protein